MEQDHNLLNRSDLEYKFKRLFPEANASHMYNSIETLCEKGPDSFVNFMQAVDRVTPYGNTVPLKLHLTFLMCDVDGSEQMKKRTLAFKVDVSLRLELRLSLSLNIIIILHNMDG